MTASFDPHRPETLTALCDMALAAGDVIMRHHRNGAVAETKADKTPVTQADRDAEALLEMRLGEIAPDIQVVGEEACATALPQKLDARFFLLDPLDGTRDFIDGKKDFTVNIALIENGLPVVGVIYAPVHEKLYFSRKDGAGMLAHPPHEGCDLEQAQTLRAAAPPPDGLRVLTSGRHKNDKTDALLDGLKITERMTASSSYKFCLLAEGTADLYPRHGRTMEWDTAAGQAILEAAGGVVADEAGARLAYGKLGDGLANPSFIASTASDWQTAYTR